MKKKIYIYESSRIKNNKIKKNDGVPYVASQVIFRFGAKI